MAYHDPYTQHHGHQQESHRPDYDDSGISPYPNLQQPYATYGQGGPTHDGYLTGNQNGFHDSIKADDKSGFGFSFPSKEKDILTLQHHRDEYRGNLWTQGGRGRCVGRFLCCTIMIAAFLIISIILALALWIRPPNVIIGSAQLDQNATGVQLQETGILVPLSVNISVSNPNYFSVNLNKFQVELSYSLNKNSTSIGKGTKDNVVFHSNANSTFTFPFNVDYKFVDDPKSAVLIDMVSKCGVLGGTRSNLPIDYKITIGLRVLIINISPSVSNTFSIACPFSDSDLQEILNKFNLSGLVDGSSG